MNIIKKIAIIAVVVVVLCGCAYMYPPTDVHTESGVDYISTNDDTTKDIWIRNLESHCLSTDSETITLSYKSPLYRYKYGLKCDYDRGTYVVFYRIDRTITTAQYRIVYYETH